MAEKKDAKFWRTELELSTRHESKWRNRARDTINVYRDEYVDSTHHYKPTQFNVLWSNTQTQRPALYSSTPKPVVKRRFRQDNAA